MTTAATTPADWLGARHEASAAQSDWLSAPRELRPDRPRTPRNQYGPTPGHGNVNLSTVFTKTMEYCMLESCALDKKLSGNIMLYLFLWIMYNTDYKAGNHRRNGHDHSWDHTTNAGTTGPQRSPQLDYRHLREYLVSTGMKMLLY